MTTVTLYDDQHALVDNAISAMRRHKSVLIQAATGFGKTRVAAHMMDRSRLKGKRVGFVVPRIELLKQTAKSLDGFGIPFGFFASGFTPNPFARVWLMSGPTLASRLDKAPQLDVIFIDECHYGGAQLDRIIRHYQSAGTWVVGLSATPLKSNGQGMGEWYSELVCGPSVRWLMDNNRLSKYQMFAPDRPDLSKLRVKNGEYIQKEVDDMMGSDEVGRVLVGSAVNQYLSRANGTLAVSFCTSVNRAKQFAQEFNDAGIPSVAVYGEMDDADLTRAVKAFARREVKNLLCAQLLEFGWDLEQASGMPVTAETEFDLNPGKSVARIRQRWGRVLRYKPYPALIFDHVGNNIEHGLPDDEPVWTLDGREKRGSGNPEPTQPTRQCPECFMVHRPSPLCPKCGFSYPVQDRKLEHVDGELIEITERIAKQHARQDQGMAKSLDDLIRLGRQKGYKSPEIWAARVMSGRMVKGARG